MDEWSVFETEIDELPAFVRFRSDAGSLVKGNYPTSFRVVWEYAADDEYQLPSDDELERLDDFEEHLGQALEDDGHAVLVFVMTNDGLRQWLFYTKDLGETTRRINAMPQEHDPYPIELTSAPDPQWSEYQRLANALRLAPS
jgi:hypothetical protein